MSSRRWYYDDTSELQLSGWKRIIISRVIVCVLGVCPTETWFITCGRVIVNTEEDCWHMEDGQWYTERGPLTEKTIGIEVWLSRDNWDVPRYVNSEMSLQVTVGRENSGQGYAGEPSLMNASPKRPQRLKYIILTVFLCRWPWLSSWKFTQQSEHSHGVTRLHLCPHNQSV